MTDVWDDAVTAGRVADDLARRQRVRPVNLPAHVAPLQAAVAAGRMTADQAADVLLDRGWQLTRRAALQYVTTGIPRPDRHYPRVEMRELTS